MLSERPIARMAAMIRKCVRVLVSGRVQGVFFRASTQAEAQRLGVVGWVRNREDHSVEFVAEGPSECVDALIAWARRGPPHAVVQSLVERDEPMQHFSSFEVRR